MTDTEIDELIHAHDEDINDHRDVFNALTQLRAELVEARKEIAAADAILAEDQRIFDALPCPKHGRCVPFVLEWIEKAQ